MRSKNFETMASYLLVDQEGGKDVVVSIGSKNFCVGRTDGNGHAETELTVEDSQISGAVMNEGTERYIPFAVQTSSKPPRICTGASRIIESRGIMVISDIDDTIKITNVRDRKMLIENTFLKPFTPVPGMAGLYRDIEREGVLFHYVSASPWQLYRPLSDFLKRAGFPDGFFYMKYVGLSKNASNLFDSSDDVKQPYIRKLLQSFKDHQVIFIGDSGERDPELYGEFARMWKDRVLGIFIRNVTEEKNDGARIRKAFNGVPSGKWRLFKNASEIAGDMVHLVRRNRDN
jgi:phosphatidate phosphatase APP1